MLIAGGGQRLELFFKTRVGAGVCWCKNVLDVRSNTRDSYVV